MTRLLLPILLLAGCSLRPAQGQSPLDDARLFLNFLSDAAYASSAYLDASLTHASFDFGASTALGVSLHVPFTRRFEGAARLQFLDRHRDFGRDRSGFGDLLLHGKVHLTQSSAPMAVGGYLSLPVGDDEVSSNSVDLGGFWAGRFATGPRTALTAAAGLDFFEVGDDYELSLNLGGGVIYLASDALALVGEVQIRTYFDTVHLLGGVDYRVGPRGQLRPALALGLSDDTADYTLMLSYLHRFRR